MAVECVPLHQGGTSVRARAVAISANRRLTARNLDAFCCKIPQAIADDPTAALLLSAGVVDAIAKAAWALGARPETIAEMRRSVWDRLGGAALVDAEIARRLEQLQAEGAIGAEEAERLRRLLLRGAPEAAPTPLFDVPSHYDLTQLKTQVDALTRTVEQLLAAQTDREPHGEPR